uniref:protein disulfide-isomerase n=1 Tax=Ditylenchus dipsaci TaxID=166011 RepID=A0A915E529_9BILA
MRFSALLCVLLCLVSTAFADSVQSILEADKDVFIKFYAPWCGHCKNLAPTFEKLAEMLSSEDVIVAKFDAQEHEVPSLFNVRGYPTLYWLPKNAKDSPIAYQGGRSVEDFIKFIAKHSSNGLDQFDLSGNKITKDPAVKNEEASVSEEPAAKKDESATEEEPAVVGDEKEVDDEPAPKEPELVTEVVTSNMKQIVLDADKDVLLQFYAPWCGHCKKFVPVYQKLALELADEDIVFAKFDATANEVDPLFEVYSVPTIFFVPKNAKESPVLYEGDRQPEDLIKFVAKHSTDGLKHFGRDGEKKMAEPTLAENEGLGHENVYDGEL